MAQRTQNYQNHTRNFALFHYVALPILALNFLNAVRHLYYSPDRHNIWEVVVAIGLLSLAVSARVMAVTVQDRVIRLEMQLRLARVLPPAMVPDIAKLKRNQFVALRFASDSELPELVREVCDGRLATPKDIKQRVKDWQADWLRA